MRFKAVLFIGFAAALVGVGPALAHHSFAMYDGGKLDTWEGTVKDYHWANPHSHIVVEVPSTAADPSLAGTWDIEGASIAIMLRQGWNKNSFHPGDRITIVGHPLKNGSKGGSLFYAIGKNGEKLYHDVDRSGRLSGVATPESGAR